ncbi:MAG: hypothetical protein AABY22_22270 [Nanoarchaeota archaeon]
MKDIKIKKLEEQQENWINSVKEQIGCPEYMTIQKYFLKLLKNEGSS